MFSCEFCKKNFFLSLWYVFVGKINRSKKKKENKIQKVINFNLETSVKNLLSHAEAKLEPSRVFAMELFWKNSSRLKKVVNYFNKKLHLRCSTKF